MNYLGSKSTPESVATKADVDLKVDKVVGKGLSTEDFTTAEQTKLAGIEDGATANSTDADLRDRATHTGVQAISTVTGLQTALDSKVDEVTGKGLSTEDYTTAEKTKLSGIATGATANATDAQLVDRANHTGVQPIYTVTGLQTALDSKAVIDDAASSTATTYSSTKLEGIFTTFSGQLSALDAEFTAGYNDLVANKVDKVAGKQLSTEDYTTVEKAKLATRAPAAFPTLTIAATMDIGAVNSETVSITSASGAIAVTSLGTASAGTIRTLVFTTLGVGAKSITHNSTSLILPGAANLSLTAGTVVSFVSLGSGNWIATNVTRSNGQAVVATPFTGGTLTSALNEASIVSIASGATMDLTSIAANTVLINSGSTGIDVTSLGVGVTGMRRTLINNVGQLTFKASSFDLIGTGDLVSGYGDVLTFVARGSSIWTCTAYVSGSGKLQTGSLQVGTAGAQQAIVDIAANSSGNQLSAPIKLHAGTNMATPENGAIEFDGTNLYITIGGVRKTFVLA